MFYINAITIAEANAIKTLTPNFDDASGEFEKTTETEVLAATSVEAA
jgi:hypothetical protein